MDELQKAIKLFEADKANSLEKLNNAKKAFNECPLCLRALIYLVKDIDDESSKEHLLFNGIHDAEMLIEQEKIRDLDVLQELMSAQKYLADYYFEYGRYSKAIRYYKKIGKNDQDCRLRLFKAGVILENEDLVLEYYEENINYVLGYLIYLYKKLAYEGLLEVFVKAKEKYPRLFETLFNRDDDKFSKEIINHNRILLDFCPNFLDYLLKIENYLN